MLTQNVFHGFNRLVVVMSVISWKEAGSDSKHNTFAGKIVEKLTETLAEGRVELSGGLEAGWAPVFTESQVAWCSGFHSSISLVNLHRK